MASAANPKATHYEHQLQSVLCRGGWAESTPGKAPNGTPISWEELLRKYRKHSRVKEAATVALQTQALSLLLLSSSDPGKASSLTPVALDGDFDASQGLLRLGDECVLQQERRDEASVALDALNQLEKGDCSDKVCVSLARAYFAYALKNPRECISIISSIDFDSSSVLATSTTFSGSVTQSSHAGGSLGSSSGAMTLGSALSRSGTVASSIVSSTHRKLEGEVGEGKVWAVIERLRGRCLEGMAYESILDYVPALNAYDLGIPLLDTLALTKVNPIGKAKIESFGSYRELWRWSERLIRRAVIVAANIRSTAEALRYLRIYQFYAQHWPTTFRSSHRSLIDTINLRALCLTPPNLQSNTSTISKVAWYEETKRVANDLKSVLEVSTVFPRAGEINKKVIDFVDLCVAAWERGGELEDDAGWVIDILWWATRLTFHSHRVMRNLTRLLAAQGSVHEAKRTFNLYVQLVSKARQTSAGDVNLQLKRRATTQPAVHPDQIAEESGVDAKLGMDEDADDDLTFTEMLVWGVSMLAKISPHFADAQEVQKVAQLARSVVESSSELKDNSRFLAKVLRAEGIASATVALREPDAKLRPLHQAAALEKFNASAELDPSSASTFYHLAFMQAEIRDIPAAIGSARQAVERNPAEIAAWHLLGLLLTAQGDWSGAKAVLELALENGEDVEEDHEDDSATIDGPTRVSSDGVNVKDYAKVPSVTITSSNASADPSLSTPTDDSSGIRTPGRKRSIIDSENLNVPRSESPSGIDPGTPTPTGTVPQPLIPKTAVLPPSSTLQGTFPDIPRASKATKFELALQLRLTQLALIELVDGADVANEKWPEVFAFFSEQCPSGPAVGASTQGSVTHDHTSSIHQSEDTHVTIDGLPNIHNSPRFNLIPASPAPSASFKPTNGDSTEENLAKKVSHRILHKGHRHIHSISKKLGGQEPPRMQRSVSTPDFHAVLSSKPYQASSIHSRSRFTSTVKSYFPGTSFDDSGEPRAFSPPPPLPQPTASTSKRSPMETRLLSDLWLTSAAMFRRMGKLEQAKAAIQEAEVLDEENPGVWIQLGLHHAAIGNVTLAIEALHKALVIEQDHVAALVHLAQQYLSAGSSPALGQTEPESPGKPHPGAVDLAAGLLNALTQAQGWDVPEAWYFLAKACGLQGRQKRERECLIYALKLQETRCIRTLGIAVPRCL